MPGHKKNLCPFCDAPGVKIKGVRSATGTSMFFQRRCAQCGARGPEAGTPYSATKAWNARRDGDQRWKRVSRVMGRTTLLNEDKAAFVRKVTYIRRLVTQALTNEELAKVFGLSVPGLAGYTKGTSPKRHAALKGVIQ